MATNSKNPRKRKSTPSGVSVPGSTESADERKAKRAQAVAAMKQAQAARERRSRLLMAGGVVVALMVVAAAVIVVGLTRKSPEATATTTASSGVVADATGVPPATYDKVGTTGAKAAPTPLKGAPALTKDGKPQVLFVGAEYCPYCAAERWAFVAALSRFGTFTGLGQTESSAQDVFPRTQTLSFHGSTYKSDYITFTPYETQDNTGKPLDKLTGADLATEQKYNFPPYVSGQGGAIPFLDIANRYVSSGATYDAGLLKGMSHAEIAQAMQDPDSKVGQAIDSSANLFTAAICEATGAKPAAVCSSSGVQAAAAALAKQTPVS